MDIALVEMIMEVAGVTQSKIQMHEEKVHEELPSDVSKKYNINNQLYTIYRVPDCPNEEIPTHVWTFYQSILYFMKKDYFMQSEESMLKEYERFLMSFKRDIDKMFYITHQDVDINLHDIKDNYFLKILSRYIELKIIIMNIDKMETALEENNKNKKIVIFEENNVYYPVIDNRFQGYEFVNETSLTQTAIEPAVEPAVEPSVEPAVEPCKVEPAVEPCKVEPSVEPISENTLRSMPKDKLIKLAADQGIEVTKQGKTKTISRTRIELISDILSKK